MSDRRIWDMGETTTPHEIGEPPFARRSVAEDAMLHLCNRQSPSEHA